MFSADLGGAAPASAPAATDPPFQKVALLLHGDGTNGAQNNTFLDSSFSDGYGVVFDGVGDYLTLSNNLSVGTGDFTAECWYYMTYNNPSFSGGALFSMNGTASGGWNAGGVGLAFGPGQIQYGSSTTASYTSYLNQWVHIAITRNSGTVTVWVNGSSVTTFTDSANYNNGTGYPVIGCFDLYAGTARFLYYGFISGLRIVTGTALYTSSFTPPSRPLSAVTGTQLLTCQSSTIIDQSTNAYPITAYGNASAVSAKPITRTGNVAQGTFSPFSLAEGQWSNYFDGSGDYLTVTSNLSASSLFTIEAWVYASTSSVGFNLLSIGNEAVNRISVGISSSNALFYNEYGSGVQSIGGTFVYNQWNHIAFVRTASTSLTGYLNGVAVGTITTSSGTLGNSSNAYIWGSSTGASSVVGYISNLRFVSGTAVYTSNFTPSTTPLTAVSGTSLLTCQSNRFKDNSSNNFTITRNGDTKVTAFSPFAPSAAYDASTNGGSGYFDGSGDYLSCGSITIGTSDYTCEGWFYSTVDEKGIFSINQSSLSSIGLILRGSFSGGYQVFYNGNYTNVTATLPYNQWVHFALVRSSTTFNFYINGVSLLTSTDSVDYPSYTIYAGFGYSSSYCLNGYLSNFRVTTSAVYTSNFTPPTAPLTTVTNTQLLLNCTNAGIIDNSGKNDIGTVGNAQISTSVKKYGTGSMYFDGTGDWLLLADRPELQLGTGNFTVEGWLYLGATGAARGIVGKGTSTTGWLLSTNSSNQVVFTYASSTITSTGTLAGSTWYHIAVCREGTGTNQTKIYINGTNDGTGTVNTDFNQTNVMYVGANRTGGDAMTGYIDDLRITKGQALYTSNFIPPTQAFPNV